ncbi:CPBP family intramembrane glutamic endopeptidase [Peribacillus tepidiphilus]|uniref:CPBP family intramembrane glutamic endopeptidase n=1 Tax=Peribacillus tepidiphilus TaxID=2652445 RepID=UPI001CDC59B4|nr:CPBP family intramembrane glutamic endopeptidase [Peribacillus tepidiphilus]
MLKKNFKLALFITFLGIIGIISIMPYQFTFIKGMVDQLGDIPIPVVLALGVVQSTILVFILTNIALLVQKRTGLDAPHLRTWVNKTEQKPFSWKWVGIGILVSFFGSLLVFVLDSFVFLPQIDTTGIEQSPKPLWWQSLLAMFYGGITEEIMVRLFLMTLIVWILAKMTRKEGKSIPPIYFWIGILLSTLLFGVGHLPATIQLFGELTPILLLRALVLNGILGVWFGYLYWKKGLEYAMISHMAADVFLHVIFTNLFT